MSYHLYTHITYIPYTYILTTTHLSPINHHTYHLFNHHKPINHMYHLSSIPPPHTYTTYSITYHLSTPIPPPHTYTTTTHRTYLTINHQSSIIYIPFIPPINHLFNPIHHHTPINHILPPHTYTTHLSITTHHTGVVSFINTHTHTTYINHQSPIQSHTRIHTYTPITYPTT
jgi:hypothetical protein